MIDLSTVVDLPPPAVEAPRTAVHESLNETVTLGLGNTYAVPSYRPLYTLTSDGTTRSIVGADDLEQFRSKQSEYVELTALGNIGATYPTLRAVYLGEVSGTVVAVPAAYGVLRTPDGLLATCQRDRRPVTHVRQRMSLPVQLRARTGDRPRRPGPAGRRPAGPPVPGRPVAAG